MEPISGPLRNSDYHYGVTIKVSNAGFTGANIQSVQSGCGKEIDQHWVVYEYCSCYYQWDDNTTAYMIGHGTPGTMTGLDFTCNFYVQKSESDTSSSWCTIHVDIPISGDNNIHCSCNHAWHKSPGTFDPCTIQTSGHSFDQTIELNMPDDS